jgi:tight adherence protein B
MVPAVILTFFAVFCLVLAVCLFFAQAKDSPQAVLKKRLQRLAQEHDAGIPNEVKQDLLKESSPFDKMVFSIPAARKLDRLIDHAGLRIKVTRFVLLVIALFVVTLLVGLLFKVKPLLLIAPLLLVPALPFAYLLYKRNKRIEQFTEQLPDALTMLARSIRAGHSLSGGVELVGNELSPPLGELFKTAFEQQKLGLGISDALQNMNDRINSIDLRFLTTAITINSTVGGNLAEVLDKLSETIRERLRIRRQVQVYTAQGRMSGYVLAALPIVTFFLFNIMMPGYEELLFKAKLGNILLVVAVCLQVIGFFVIRKIINIRI